MKNVGRRKYINLIFRKTVAEKNVEQISQDISERIGSGSRREKRKKAFEMVAIQSVNFFPKISPKDPYMAIQFV